MRVSRPGQHAPASSSFAMWFVALAMVTFWGAFGALAQNIMVRSG